jgi:hypothetical protein
MKPRELHGMSFSRLYKVWMDMRRRCYSPKAFGYQWYGGKGVQVCQEWFLSFLAFKAWALATGYTDDLTIDRKDSSKGYGPENCQWLTKHENCGKWHRTARKAS